MKKANKLIALILTFMMVCSLLPMTVLADETEDTSDRFIIMSTTDVHGKVWDYDFLAQDKVKDSLLNAATGVAQIREQYGDRVLLVDNGDLFQGTPVSSTNINRLTTGETTDPNPMAIALKYMDYDAAVLGNHEFNYSWKTMTGVYDYLADETQLNPVKVICANLYYDGNDGVHEAGERVFEPYYTKTFKVDGQDFTVLLIGLENTDCTRWDIGDNYPNILFSSPENPTRDMVYEVNKVLDEVKAAGIEPDFTVLSYHSGLGDDADLTADKLELGTNTEGQVLRVIKQTTGIDMVIAGHDHSGAYSGNKYPNADGEEILVVNAAQTNLSETVFEAKANADGSFTVTQLTADDAHNVPFSTYAVDEGLKALIQPYADAAESYVNTSVGSLVGEWDNVRGTSRLYIEQSDTMDLIGRAQIAMGTKYINDKYASVDEVNAKLRAIYGDDTKKQLTGDKIEVDMSSTSVVVNGQGGANSGDISIKDIYTFYRYDNSLYLLALTGREIKAMLEYNASERIDAKVAGGELHVQTKGDGFTNPVFYGLNFTYDMYQAEGNRAVIEGFSNGKKFDLDETYIFAINNYHLHNSGNEELAKYDESQQLWSQTDDLGGGFCQDLIAAYITMLTERDGGVYSNSAAKDGVNGNGEKVAHWSVSYSGDMSTTTLPDTTALIGAEATEVTDGMPIILYNDSVASVLSSVPNGNKMSIAEATRVGNRVYAPAEAAVLTATKTDGGWYLKAEGGYLTYPATGNGLSLEAEATQYSVWDFEPVEGGFNVHCVNANYNGNYNQYLEVYGGKYTTYGISGGGPAYVYGVYSLATTGVLKAELADGDKVAIVNPALSMAIGQPNGNKMAGPSAYVSATETSSVAELPVDATIFEVSRNADGKLLLKAEGGYLSYGASGNSLTLSAEAGDLSLWELEPVEGETGLYNVHCVNASYNDKANQYLERYYENFTTYGFNGGGDAYNYSFYAVAATGVTPAEEPKAPVAEAPIEGYVLPVIETSDVHGFMVDVSSGKEESYQYRMAYISDKVDDLRKGDNKTVLLLDGGDIYQGNVVSNLQDGEPMMALYDLMDYDAVALGNHEFDWGVTTVADADGTMGSYTVSTYTGDSNVPILISNLTLNGEPVTFAQPYVILEKTATDKDGNTVTVKIGVIGYADDYKADIMYDKFTGAGYVITEDPAALEALAVKLETELDCDATVLLGHMDAPAMAASLEKDTVIDLVCGGHSHNGQTGVSSGVTYIQPKNQAQNYAFAKLVFVTDDTGAITGVKVVDNEIIDVSSDNKSKLTDTTANANELDAEILALSKASVAVVEPELKEVLGTVDVAITKDAIGANGMTSTAGNWMTSLMAKAVGAQVAFTNNGGIRTELKLEEGATSRSITVGDVYTIAPFGNLIYAYDLTYAELLDVLNYSIGSGASLGLRMSGIDCYYTGSAVTTLVTADGTVIYHDGQWIDGYDTKTVKVATNEYVATSNTPFKAWNGTAKLYASSEADNESMITVLTAEGKANGGKLTVDAKAHMISGAYTGTVTPKPEPEPQPEPQPEPEPEPQPEPQPVTYTVQKGDSLSSIAKKLLGDSKYWRNIYEANKATLKSADMINIGQVLTIPDVTGATTPAKPEPEPATPSNTYTVQKGDSLYSIAKKLYGDASKWSRIYEANKATLKSADMIDIGQVLVIPE